MGKLTNKQLSPTMRDCLHWLIEHGADKQWVQVNVGGNYNHNTLKALSRRGLIEICYRHRDFNPNDWPRLSIHQHVLNSYTCAFNDPWVRLLGWKYIDPDEILGDSDSDLEFTIPVDMTKPTIKLEKVDNPDPDDETWPYRKGVRYFRVKFVEDTQTEASVLTEYHYLDMSEFDPSKTVVNSPVPVRATLEATMDERYTMGHTKQSLFWTAISGPKEGRRISFEDCPPHKAYAWRIRIDTVEEP